MGHQVIIVGAGFGGLTAAKILSQCSKIDLTVIDRCNHHLFQPLLYQVASAALSPADIAVPIRSELSPASDAKFRNALQSPNGAAKFCSFTQSRSLNFGIAHVSIPRIHKQGRLEERCCARYGFHGPPS